ncbi:MAG: hypothetical protein PHR90_01490 [Sphaerochaetaceae bacterium]|nr:hypothetical protein [Sphaerochaetaceae bacterium]MDD3941126.1 hypothetical protein [Sphaerochaetaceae bacterium]MDX9938475.1 hypothetical protein [Sphaerochaetaceae bacterium]
MPHRRSELLRSHVMHKIAIMFLLPFLTAYSVFAVHSSDANERLSDLRYLSMGSAGVALTEFQGSFLRNPAALYRRTEPLFRVGTRYGETILASAQPSDPVPWIQMPTTSVEMLFSNRFVALSIGLGNVLEEREAATSEVRFTAYNDSRIQLSAAYGWQTISVGLFARGGNSSKRDVVIREGSAMVDYLTRTYLERYDRKNADGQYFASGLGVLISYQWVSIGLMTDSLFGMDYTTNELTLDIADTFEGSSLGLAFSTPVYDRDNELNLIVVNGVFDATDLGNSQKRAVRFGIEGKVQFLNNLSGAVRAGYWEHRPADEALFSIAGSGTLTVGLGARVGNAGIDVAAEIPLTNTSAAVSVGLTWGM